jgi:hypothetical protein
MVGAVFDTPNDAFGSLVVPHNGHRSWYPGAYDIIAGNSEAEAWLMWGLEIIKPTRHGTQRADGFNITTQIAWHRPTKTSRSKYCTTYGTLIPLNYLNKGDVVTIHSFSMLLIAVIKKKLENKPPLRAYTCAGRSFDVFRIAKSLSPLRTGSRFICHAENFRKNLRYWLCQFRVLKGTVAWDFSGYFLAWIDLSRPEWEPLLVFIF